MLLGRGVYYSLVASPADLHQRRIVSELLPFHVLRFRESCSTTEIVKQSKVLIGTDSELKINIACFSCPGQDSQGSGRLCRCSSLEVTRYKTVYNGQAIDAAVEVLHKYRTINGTQDSGHWGISHPPIHNVAVIITTA